MGSLLRSGGPSPTADAPDSVCPDNAPAILHISIAARDRPRGLRSEVLSKIGRTLGQRLLRRDVLLYLLVSGLPVPDAAMESALDRVRRAGGYLHPGVFADLPRADFGTDPQQLHRPHHHWLDVRLVRLPILFSWQRDRRSEER